MCKNFDYTIRPVPSVYIAKMLTAQTVSDFAAAFYKIKNNETISYLLETRASVMFPTPKSPIPDGPVGDRDPCLIQCYPGSHECFCQMATHSLRRLWQDA